MAILKFYTLAADNADYMHRSGIVVMKQGHNRWMGMYLNHKLKNVPFQWLNFIN